ncbi:unnamed protein product [Rotaria socialis]|uniref:Uncharacterized protein n=2 Tax=Rotaria socialis TaxID=392032 RepID=A0A821RNP8_9BILA|nr:unnamed protein product [Rotaria socialis]
MTFICRNIDQASKLKIFPGVMFSEPVESYIKELADIHSIHPDSFAIVLLNFVAATLEFSFVLRANSVSNKIPTNLFNIVVARSSFGKSDLTRILRDMLNTVVLNRPMKFRSTNQINLGSEGNPCLDEMSKAGLMSSLDECCRLLICDEADMTFADAGLFLSNNNIRTSAEMNCRGLMMTLFDRVSHAYIRQLSNRSVSVKSSKLNILGCSTGDIISNMIIRIKAGACFDPAIGRFIFWPLDGPVIPDKLIQRQIDNKKYPSLAQFAIILSFIENSIFSFDEDAINEMIDWGNTFKQKSNVAPDKIPSIEYFTLGFEERNNNESLSARLGKTVQHAYRIATFLQTIEIGFQLSKDYINQHQFFPENGSIDHDFVENISEIFKENYVPLYQVHDPESIKISKNVVLRAIDIMSCNLRQFILLFDGTNAPKVSSIGRQIVMVSQHENKSFSNDQALVAMKQRQRQILNHNDVAASIILFPSVCFTMKQLHKSAVIHNHSGGGLLKQVITTLVETNLLEMCERGIKHASRTTCVYVKRLPLENDMDSQEQFSSILSEYTYRQNPISIDLYKKSCESMLLEAVGTVQEDVIPVLKRSEYGERDFSTFINLPKTIKPKTSLCNNQAMAVTTENNNLFQNIIDENAILTIGSSHVDHLTTSSSCSNFPQVQNIFDNVNLVNQQPNLDSHSIHSIPEEEYNEPNIVHFFDSEQNINSDVINVFDEQQSNDLNNIDLFNAEQSVDLNNLDTIRQQQPTDSAQNTNSDNNNILHKGKKNTSSTFFFSPTAGRTRSKLKVRKTQNQQSNGTIFF